MSISVVFPGQASQYPNMGLSILNEMPELNEYYIRASEILDKDIKKVIFGDKDKFMENQLDIQPAVFLTSYVAYEYIKRKYDIKSCCFAGHSLGEITSLVASGMLSFDDGMKLVKYRSRYMVEASSNVMGGMTSITQFSPELVTKFCEDFEGVWVSCYNSNHQTVIGGKIECLTKAEEKLLSMGAKVKRLSTIGAFHTPLMLEAANQLYEYIQKMDIHEPNAMVISNVTARPYSRLIDVKKLLRMQMILPVQWEKTISYIEDMYITRLIECGPRSTLSNLLKDRSNKLIPYSTDKSQLDFLRDTQDKQFYVKDLVKECECAVSCCKNKAEDYNVITCKEYYEKLINMKLKSNLIYHDEDVIEAFNYIEKILCCKGYNSDEISQIERTIEKKLGFVVDL